MRILKMVFIGLAALAFVSCQKELSLENPNHLPPPPGPGPGPDTLGDLLVRSVISYSTTDSVVTTYGYDASKQLIAINTSGSLSGSLIDNKRTIKRDGSGNITQIVLVDAQAGGGTLTTDVFYDATNNHYSYTIIKAIFGGTTYVDSAVFAYDAGGRISTQDDYLLNPLGVYELDSRNGYTYAGTGIDSAKLFLADQTSGALTSVSVVVYTYDNSANPLILSNGDAILLSFPELYSPHNNNSRQSIDLNVPSNGFTISTAYTYNSKNKPIIGTTNFQGQIFSTAYYYQ